MVGPQSCSPTQMMAVRQETLGDLTASSGDGCLTTVWKSTEATLYLTEY